ncbi:hypothetical protein C8J31_107250 [Rhizobium sp. PP-CC-2G-626]|nr:hypothetical protein C8J31_107250 [Rhizobium sp. PP-CC-2G-626]
MSVEAVPFGGSQQGDNTPVPARGFGAASGTAGRRIATLLLRGGSLAVFVAVLIVFSVTAPYFLSVGNIGNVLGQSAIAGVLAIGLTVVIIAGGGNVVTGGIDLSLAANMGLSAAVYAALSQAGLGDAVAVAGALATGLRSASSMRSPSRLRASCRCWRRWPS